MKTPVILFLTLCTMAASSQEPDNWLTPFATVEFKQNKILYYYTPSEASPFLKPIFLPVSILLIAPAYDRYLEHEDVTFWKPIIREDAEGKNIISQSRDEKLDFLKAFTLQSIWGINQSDEMPSQDAWLLVSGLSDDQDAEIAGKAKLAAELYELIRQGIEEMDKMRKKQH